jgi:molecular chaperone GrpE
MPMHKEKKEKQEKTEAIEETEEDALKAEVEELRDKNLRQLAELDNYRKQLDKEKEEYMRHCNEKLLCEILEVVDNFERAIPEIWKKDPKAAEGVDMIYKQLLKILEKHGLRGIDACGVQFDPYKHEAFIQEESDKPEGTVLEELQKGYVLHNKVVRHSKVKIAKKKNKED